MEIEGHPTQDIVEELQTRGAVLIAGGTSGPDAEAVRFLAERLGEGAGSWLFLPPGVFNTGFDDLPAQT